MPRGTNSSAVWHCMPTDTLKTVVNAMLFSFLNLSLHRAKHFKTLTPRVDEKYSQINGPRL